MDVHCITMLGGFYLGDIVHKICKNKNDKKDRKAIRAINLVLIVPVLLSYISETCLLFTFHCWYHSYVSG